MFLVTLCWEGPQPGGDFLQPTIHTLEEFGCTDACKMQKNYQVWRFITPMFLHGGFLHILFNTISLIMFGSWIEKTIGTKNIMIIYFIGGIGGNLFSVLINYNAIAFGASTGIAALMGAYLAYIIVNWEAWDYEGSPRCMMCCFVGFLLFWNILAGNTSSLSGADMKVDNWGHLGGLIAGCFMSMGLIKAEGGRNGPWEKKVKNIGLIGLGVYLIGGLVIFYTAIKPRCF